MRTSCPNCSSIWGVGSEEWEWQQCWACGWPDVDDGDLEDDDWEDDYEDERNDPNDSRNL